MDVVFFVYQLLEDIVRPQEISYQRKFKKEDEKVMGVTGFYHNFILSYF